MSDVKKIVTESLIGMISGVTGLVPPDDGSIPDFIQAPIDRAAYRISLLFSAKDVEIARLNHALAVKEEFYQDALHSHIVLAKQRDELRAQLDAQPAQKDEHVRAARLGGR